MDRPVDIRSDCEDVDWVALTRALAADDFDNGRTPFQLEASFRASASVVLARVGSQLIGTARALSDGVCNAYVVDMWTRASHRRRGIGRRMLERLIAPFEGQHVYLFSDDRVDFYTACGFVPRGTGMERMVGTWLMNETRK
ncbi:MAG TPA: GNAT family N-acetyltransferase [Casimicrobiaceae bacterium]|nr:GNAT family N-acetyltransferase [Casimicrobiaceae bacterium]